MHSMHGGHNFSASYNRTPSHSPQPPSSPQPPPYSRNQSLPTYKHTADSTLPPVNTQMRHHLSEQQQRSQLSEFNVNMGSMTPQHHPPPHQMQPSRSLGHHHPQVSESYSQIAMHPPPHAHSQGHSQRYTSYSNQMPYGDPSMRNNSASAYHMQPLRAGDMDANWHYHDDIVPPSPVFSDDHPFGFDMDHEAPLRDDEEDYTSQSESKQDDHESSPYDAMDRQRSTSPELRKQGPRLRDTLRASGQGQRSRSNRKDMRSQPAVRRRRTGRRREKKLSKRRAMHRNRLKNDKMTHMKYVPSTNPFQKKSATKQFLTKIVRNEQMFRDFDDKAIEKLVDKMYRVDVPPNRSIIREGDSPEAYFVIQRGTLYKLESYGGAKHKQHLSTDSVESVSHKLTRVKTLKPKNAFGQENMLYAQPHEYTYRAGREPDMNLHADADSHHEKTSFIACRCWALDLATWDKIRYDQASSRYQHTTKVLKFLKSVEMFSKMTEDDLQSVADELVTEIDTYKMEYNQGDDIICEGETAVHFYIIYKGTCTVTRIRKGTTGTSNNGGASRSRLENEGMENQREIVREEIGPGEFFGEVGIIKKQKRECTVTVTSPSGCTVYVIPKDRFKAWFEQYAEVHEAIDGKITEYTKIPESAKEFENRVKCTLADFKQVGVLGVGAFGRVSLVENTKDGEVYALKRVCKNRIVESGQQQHILNEKKIMAALDSAFCIKLFATFTDKLNVYFLLEPVLGGELFSILRQYNKIGQRQASFYSACVVLALEHLHVTLNVIYRDLKPENLLIAANGYCKLVDFGFAKKRNNTCTLCGTPQYMAPEVIQNLPQGFAVDWWSFGILIYEMIFGYPPFLNDAKTKMYQKILSSPILFPEPKPKSAKTDGSGDASAQPVTTSKSEVKEYTKDIIKALLRKRAHKRLGSGAKGAEQIKRHRFFRHVDWDKMLEQSEDPPFTPEIRGKKDISYFDRFPDLHEDEELVDDPDGTRFKWCDEF